MFAIYKTNERFLLAGKSYYDDYKKIKGMMFYRLINIDTAMGYKAKGGKIQNIKSVGKSILYDYFGDKSFAEEHGAHFHNDLINENNVYVTSKEILNWIKEEDLEKKLKNFLTK